jgi:hypothetical protein
LTFTDFVDPDIRETLGWLFVGLTVTTMGLNVLLAMIEMIKNLIVSIRNKIK